MKSVAEMDSVWVFKIGLFSLQQHLINEALKFSEAFLKMFSGISWLLLVFLLDLFANYRVSVLVNA